MIDTFVFFIVFSVDTDRAFNRRLWFLFRNHRHALRKFT